MLQAYFRGLLSPGYEQGARSVARENMILWALTMENTGNAIINSVQVETALVGPHIDIKKSKDYIRRTSKRLRYASEKKQFSVLTMDEMFRTAEDAVKDLAALYQEAKRSGVLDAFRKQVDKILQKIQ